ncbi:MAG: hypothetical protein LBU45_03710 [Azoarcus sp.]|jgi:hypothetical protein|nr:hypothetical protein [Azoarcus sp.]
MTEISRFDVADWLDTKEDIEHFLPMPLKQAMRLILRNAWVSLRVPGGCRE